MFKCIYLHYECHQNFNSLPFLIPSWHGSWDSHGEYPWGNPCTRVWSNIHTGSWRIISLKSINIKIKRFYQGIKQKRPPQIIHCRILKVSCVLEVTCDIDWLWCIKLYYNSLYRVLAVWADNVYRVFSKLDRRSDLGQGLGDHHHLGLRHITSVHGLSCNRKRWYVTPWASLKKMLSLTWSSGIKHCFIWTLFLFTMFTITWESESKKAKHSPTRLLWLLFLLSTHNIMN